MASYRSLAPDRPGVTGQRPLLAQLDRAPGFEPGGWGFKSLRAGQRLDEFIRAPIPWMLASLAVVITPRCSTSQNGDAYVRPLVASGRCKTAPGNQISNFGH